MSTASGLDFRLPDLGRLPPAGAPLMDASRPAWTRFIKTVWHTEVRHADRLPDGPCLLATNHVGVLDGPLAVALTPRSQAMAKSNLWASRSIGWFLDSFGQIPVDRDHTDTLSIRLCLQALEAGRRIMVFPEGHRGAGRFDVFRPGIAYLALVTGAPVVPMALVGTSTGGVGLGSLPRPRSSIHVVYGEPVAVEPKAWPRTTREVAHLAQRLQAACQQHVQQARREVGLELPPEDHP